MSYQQTDMVVDHIVSNSPELAGHLNFSLAVAPISAASRNQRGLAITFLDVAAADPPLRIPIHPGHFRRRLIGVGRVGQARPKRRTPKRTSFTAATKTVEELPVFVAELVMAKDGLAVDWRHLPGRKHAERVGKRPAHRPGDVAVRTI
jgi:hypothetical protein